MKDTVFSFQTSDKKNICYRKWDNVSKPKAVLQIVHGMAEHTARYAQFADYLNIHSFIVYAHDQRGHGQTAGLPQNVGFLSNKNGWQKIVDDVLLFTKIIKSEKPRLPIFILGHSMGSFVTRCYLNNYSTEVRGAIISGTGGEQGLKGRMGQLVVNIEKMFRGKQAKSTLMNNLTLGAYSRSFKPKRTDFDWLSRDTDIVDAYVSDPFCGTIFSTSFFCNLFQGVFEANKLSNIVKIRKTLPVMFIAGKNDPVGNFGKGVRQVYDKFRSAGINNSELKLYDNARHEMLNEINRIAVYNDIIEWLNKQLSND